MFCSKVDDDKQTKGLWSIYKCIEPLFFAVHWMKLHVKSYGNRKKLGAAESHILKNIAVGKLQN